MKNKHDMETLVSVLAKIEAMGYIAQFRVTPDGLHSQLSGQNYNPEDITVDHFYRFEGESSQDDEAILYAIATGSGEKGTLTDGYGTSGDAAVASFMRQVTDITK
jgi:hypothetical protein